MPSTHSKPKTNKAMANNNDTAPTPDMVLYIEEPGGASSSFMPFNHLRPVDNPHPPTHWHLLTKSSQQGALFRCNIGRIQEQHHSHPIG